MKNRLLLHPFEFQWPTSCRWVAVLIGLLILTLGGAFSLAAPTPTNVVLNHNDSGYGSLREVIRDLTPGDTVRFAPNVTGVIALTGGELVIDKDLAIEGPGRSVLTLDALNASRLFRVARGVARISGLSLRNGFVRGADGANAASFIEPGQPGEPARGGAILNLGELTVSDCLLSGHTALAGRGGEGAPDVAGAPATRGGAGGEATGGAIYNGHRLVIANSTMEGTFARAGGGGAGGYATFAANGLGALGGHGSGGLGGGIYNLGTMMASNCLFYGGHAEGGDGGAGGDASTFQGRTGGDGGLGGPGHGGGLCNLSTALVVNCTFTLCDGQGGAGGSGANGINRDGAGGNGGDSFGGAIFNQAGREVMLIHDTIAYCRVVPGDEGSAPNSQDYGDRGTAVGGGVYGETVGQTRFLNTLVAFNTANTSHHDVFGLVTSLGYNFIRDRDLSSGWNTTDQTGFLAALIDPQLHPFGDNGGPSPTFLPRRGSPLVERGDRGVLSAWSVLTDQRGAYRRAGAHVDIGAVEAPYGVQRVVANTNDHGLGSLREALAEAQADAAGPSALVTVDFAPWVRGTIVLTSGELPIRTQIWLSGPGADLLAISGNHRSRVFHIMPGEPQESRIIRLAICDGLVQGNTSITYGGGILAEAPLYLSNCVISNNMVTGRHGANGVGAASGEPGGAAFGGGIHHTRRLTIHACVITANWSLGGNGGNGGHGRNGGDGGGGYGGGISGNNGTDTSLALAFVGHSLVQDNVCHGGRGGTGRPGLPASGNSGEGGAAHGGGLHVVTGTPAFESLSVRVWRSTLSGNRAIGGLGGTGGVDASAGVEGNDGGTGLGGGAVLNLPADLINCTLSGNQAKGGNGGDGGLVAGIRAQGGGGGTAAGGGLLRSPSYPGGMSNCTVTANTAQAGLGGLTTGGTRLGFGTAAGGGVWDSAGGSAQMTVMSCIVAGNDVIGLSINGPGTEVDWFGPCVSAGYNLIGVTNASTGFGAIGDKLGSAALPLDAKLDPLQDNGGAVFNNPEHPLEGTISTNRPFLLLTHALLPGSPALDAGQSSQFFDERGAPRRQDDLSLPNAPGGDGSDIGAVEDGQLRIVGLRDPNQNPSVLFTTLPARDHFLESEDALVPAQWIASGSPLFGTGGIGELPDLSQAALSRFYRIRADVMTSQLVYSNDFESPLGGEWNPATLSMTPISARRFLGEFANQTVTLQLASLPAHTQLRVRFDLFILKSWDGNRTDFGPDTFQLSVPGGSTLIRSTFSTYTTQSHPGNLGESYPANVGALEVNTLGYTHPNLGPADAVYHLTATFDHAAPTVTLDFSGVNLQDIPDESWGLDNVHVEAINTP